MLGYGVQGLLPSISLYLHIYIYNTNLNTYMARILHRNGHKRLLQHISFQPWGRLGDSAAAGPQLVGGRLDSDMGRNTLWAHGFNGVWGLGFRAVEGTTPSI